MGSWMSSAAPSFVPDRESRLTLRDAEEHRASTLRLSSPSRIPHVPLPPTYAVADELLASVLATPRRQRRLLSRTFWSLFGMTQRTAARVAAVRAALSERELHVTVGTGAELGTEPRECWLTLAHVPAAQVAQAKAPVARPPEAWFSAIAARRFESEREVEHYFILPLLEALGYGEDDFCIGCPVLMFEGVKKVAKQADVVVFDGPGRDGGGALLVVEAKRFGRPLTEDAVGQARAYALWLTTPYYLVTNGESLRVYLFRGAMQPDVLMQTGTRAELPALWDDLVRLLNREAVVAHKARLAAALAGTLPA